MIGKKVTVRFLSGPFPFLRCYVIRRVSNGWQLYDPIRDWSWGTGSDWSGQRVIYA